MNVEDVTAAFTRALGIVAGPDDDFFGLGGDSLTGVLLLIDLQERLGVTLNPSAVLSNPTPRQLAAAIRDGSALEAQVPAATPTRVADRGPVSPIQRAALLTAATIASRGFVYWVYQLNGNFDVEALARAVDEVVARHDVLRTRFGTGPDGLEQVVAPFAPGVLEVVDLRDAGLDKQAEIEAALDAVRARYRALSPYDDAAFRATVHLIAAKTSMLSMFVGEALLDGEGGALVAAELSRAYARHAGLPVPGLAVPEPLGTRYLDHVLAHPVPPAAEQAAREHWRRQADAVPAAVDWPVEPAGRVASTWFELGPDELVAFLATVRALRTTPYVAALSCFLAALARLGVADHLLVGAAVSDRVTAATERMLGPFASTVRVEGRVLPGDRFPDLVARTAAALGDAVTHRAVPVELAAPPGNVVEFFMFEERPGLDLAGVRQRRFRLHSTQVPLTLNCRHASDGTQRFTFSSATAGEERLADLATAVREELDAVVAGVAAPA